jgi:hypothetical protein
LKLLLLGDSGKVWFEDDIKLLDRNHALRKPIFLGFQTINDSLDHVHIFDDLMLE